MEEILQISELTAVGQMGDLIILCVKKGDEQKSNPISVQYDLGAQSYHIDTTDKFTKFSVFEQIDLEDELVQRFYRGWISRKLPTQQLLDSLIDFSKEGVDIIDNSPIQKAYLAGLISDDQIEKAWKKHPIGTVTTRKDGKQYRKVAETGNVENDWKLVQGDKKQKTKDEDKSKDKKTPETGEAKDAEVGLDEHAKNTSETNLQTAIKSSSDPEIRQTAHEELDRREKEEKPQEEEDSKGKKEGEEDPIVQKFRTLSDEQIQFYLKAPYEDVKKAAKFVADERGLEMVETFEPLIFGLSDHSKIKKYFDEYDEEVKSLDKNQHDILEYYRKGSEMINQFLRSDSEEDSTTYPKTKERIEYMRSAFDNFALKDDLILHRGVKNADFFSKLKAGDVYEDKGFCSTSLSPIIASSFSRGEHGFNLKIMAKKGTRAIPMEHIGDEGTQEEFSGESEILLKDSSRFKVTSVDKNNITVELL